MKIVTHAKKSWNNLIPGFSSYSICNTQSMSKPVTLHSDSVYHFPPLPLPLPWTPRLLLSCAEVLQQLAKWSPCLCPGSLGGFPPQSSHSDLTKTQVKSCHSPAQEALMYPS
uniref:Macaca fascicularis brain cDNA clone: QflA-16090, similar to human similar to pleckstrin homology domain protein (5V327)(LOC400224), mRNA, RefSeq: XM_375090.1 n=1 Tax=Macaca fascicularis TaxID=9541 RepID=I7GI02_MACFA|nr:unnamed protein product [Macaca fascicularis]